ncbi:unnamed protein product, partial [marine sediment metagenome]
MRVAYLSSYDKNYKKLPKNKQLKAEYAIDILIDFFKIGQKPKGLGLKKLKNNYWEIRVDLHYRIIFELEKDLISFV